MYCEYLLYWMYCTCCTSLNKMYTYYTFIHELYILLFITCTVHILLYYMYCIIVSKLVNGSERKICKANLLVCWLIVFLNWNPEEGRRITHFPVNSRSKQNLLQVGVNKHQHTFVNLAVPLYIVFRICSYPFLLIH